MLPSCNMMSCGTPSGSPLADAGMLKIAQWRVSSGPDAAGPAPLDPVTRDGTSASCKMSAKVTVACGAAVHSMAGETLPAGVFAYLGGMTPPSGNAGIVILTGVGTLGRPPAFSASWAAIVPKPATRVSRSPNSAIGKTIESRISITSFFQICPGQAFGAIRILFQMSDGSSLSGPSQRAVLLAFAGLASAIITRITGNLASQLRWLYP